MTLRERAQRERKILAAVNAGTRALIPIVLMPNGTRAGYLRETLGDTAFWLVFARRESAAAWTYCGAFETQSAIHDMAHSYAERAIERGLEP